MFDNTAVCANLTTAYNNAAAQLALLPAEDSVSEKGRAISRQRASIVQHMAALRQEMDANGCPDVPGGGALGVLISRARA